MLEEKCLKCSELTLDIIQPCMKCRESASKINRQVRFISHKYGKSYSLDRSWEPDIYYIYKIINLKTHQVIYVGATHNPQRRAREHSKSFTNGAPALNEILRKEGLENFKLVTIERIKLKCKQDSTHEDRSYFKTKIQQRERHWIKKLNTSYPNGCNKSNLPKE